MSADMIVLPDGSVPIPAPQHKGFETLCPELHKLRAYLPHEVHGETKRFLSACIAEANSTNLKDCSPASVCRAVFNCARIGLIPGATLGHAFFIPYGPQCTLVVGYKGYTDLAYGCGFLRSVHCEVVLDGETFERWNDENGEHYRHVLPPGRQEKWDNILAAYCRWESTTGGRGSELVERPDLQTLYDKGCRGKLQVWKNNPVPMSKKTAMLRAARQTWKLTGRMQHAVYLDTLGEIGKSQPLLSAPDGAEPLQLGLSKPGLDQYDNPPTEADPTEYDKPDF